MSAIQDSSVVLEVSNLNKCFGNFVANDQINFNLTAGEIHCLLGENGAGKSTFAKCLYGAYHQDTGTVKVNGFDVKFNSPRDAIHHGIGMVHQHFVLVPTMTVVENIVVGVEKSGISTGIKDAAKKVVALSEKFGVELDPHALVANLAVGQQQWVEILKALFSGVEILILDEPTAALTPQESEQLFSIIKKMTMDGTSVIFITHKLNEVMQVSDRITIFRKGKKVGSVKTSTTNKIELATLMVGRGVHFEVEKETLEPGTLVMEIRDLSASSKDKRESLKSINLSIYQNEILGIAGVGGNGQSELFDAIIGIHPISGGNIYLNGDEITRLKTAKILGKGLASIPSDRMTQGLLLEFTVAENLILGSQWVSPFKSGILLKEKEIIKNAENLIKEYEIATSGPEQVAARLSGGNLQKLILARELSRDITCVMANCPTRGLDVGAIEYVHQRLVELRDQGIGVMLISEDLDEIFNVADRIAVIYQGKIMGEFKTNQTSREQIGLLMAGVTEGIK
ncbi:MAG: ABC transporter ATP-binding protein [Chloroflexota bacterium]